MASKQEWSEYFEFINNRKPTEGEINVAISNREIDDESEVNLSKKEINSNKKNNDSNQNNFTSQGNSDVKKTVEEGKKISKNYFSWLTNNLKRQDIKTKNKNDNNNFWFGLFSTIATFILLSFSFKNVFHALTVGTPNYMHKQINLIDKAINGLSINIFFLLLSMFVLNLVLIYFVLGFISRNKIDFKSYTENVMKVFSPMILISVVALLISFFAPKYLDLINIGNLLDSASSSSSFPEVLSGLSLPFTWVSIIFLSSAIYYISTYSLSFIAFSYRSKDVENNTVKNQYGFWLIMLAIIIFIIIDGILFKHFIIDYIVDFITNTIQSAYSSYY